MPTEVELRGPLAPEQYTAIRAQFAADGVAESLEDRFLIDYSTMIEGIGDRVLDVRVRATNGQPELVVKKGQFGGVSRLEAAAHVFREDFPGLLSAMALLGYTRGVAADRGIVRSEVGGIEFALQDVRQYGRPGATHSRFYEAEILLEDDSQVDIAEALLRSRLGELGLDVFSVEEWNEYVAVMNREANGVFDIADPHSMSLALRVVDEQRS